MLSHPLLEGLLGDDQVQHLVNDADHAYVTISTRSGPHATPEVHMAWGGRIWLMVTSETVKAKVLRRRPEVGVLARAGTRGLLVAGEARLLDPTRPDDALRSISEAMLSGAAVAGYLGRNQQDLLGFVRDALSGDLGRRPSPPVLLAVRPRAVVVTDGTTVVTAEGEWPGRRGAHVAHPEDDHERVGSERGGSEQDALATLPDLPREVSGLLEGERDCVVGWESPLGPLGLPGRWVPDRGVAVVPSELFALGDLPARSGACLTLDAIEEHHPAGKYGVVLRGPATASVSGDAVDVRVRAERVTWWQGKETETEPVE